MSQTPPAAAFDPTPAWETYLEKNFKKLLLLVVLIILGVVAYGIVNYLNNAKAVAAGEAYSSAKTVEDLDVVIQQYAGTMSAGNALLQKADLLWEQNKKTTSIEALREFTEKYSKHPFVAQTLLALGSKLESTGNRSEAKPVFERIVKEFGNSDVAALAELRLGDVLWAEGKEDEAKKIYEGLAAKFPGVANEILDQGESRTQWIAAKLPTKEVDGPPKPKVEAPAAGATIPGMPPQFKLNAGTPLSPTVTSPVGAANSQVINVTPNGATSGPITVTPGAMPAVVAPIKLAAPLQVTPAAPVMPAPAATTPAVSVPAVVPVVVPAAPTAPVVAPAPPAPAVAPKAP